MLLLGEVKSSMEALKCIYVHIFVYTINISICDFGYNILFIDWNQHKIFRKDIMENIHSYLDV